MTGDKAKAYWRRCRDGQIDAVVLDCPHCHRRHYHGIAEADSARPDFGRRLAHCCDNFTGILGYELINAGPLPAQGGTNEL